MSAMNRREFVAFACSCARCGHKWLAFKVPTACAACKSKYWNKPRVRRRKRGRPPKA